MVSAGAVSGLIAMFVAQPVIKFFGNINILTSAIWIEGARFIIYSLVVWVTTCFHLHENLFFCFVYKSQIPPYYAIALHTLDALVWSIPWIATMQYGYRIAPPDYIATMTACIGTMEFIICK